MRALAPPFCAVLLASLLAACLPGGTAASPAPTATTAAARTSVPATTPTATATPRTPAPTPTPAASATPAATACARETGGGQGAGAPLAEVRIGTPAGVERVVFDFGPGPLPQYTVEQATSFVAPSGQTVPVQGAAHIGVRLSGAGGMGTYRGATSFQPSQQLIREVRLVEDFEGVLVWGIGLARQSCPRVFLLSAPTRLVIDFPVS